MDQNENFCTLKSGRRVPAVLKLATMLLIHSMKDHHLIFKEVVIYCRSERPDAKLTRHAVDFLRAHNAIPRRSDQLDEDTRDIIRLAVQGDPIHPEIQNPEVYPDFQPTRPQGKR